MRRRVNRGDFLRLILQQLDIFRPSAKRVGVALDHRASQRLRVLPSRGANEGQGCERYSRDDRGTDGDARLAEFQKKLCRQHNQRENEPKTRHVVPMLEHQFKWDE